MCTFVSIPLISVLLLFTAAFPATDAEKEAHGTLAVRPFTVHFFHDIFGRNLTQTETDQYLHILQNHLISKDQALRKLDSMAHEKGDGFEKSYLKWKKAQEKHNIQWWQVNDFRMQKTSGNAQNLYESIKAVHFNKTLSFREDCNAYNTLIESATKPVRTELEWPTLNCTLDLPALNPHGRIDFKLIL